MTGQLATMLVTRVVAAGPGISAAVWSGGDHSNDTQTSSTATTGHGSGSGLMETAIPDEQAFLEQMVPHHESAIEMANLALKKTDPPEIRRPAQQIVAAQAKEIGQMQRRHEQWFPPLG